MIKELSLSGEEGFKVIETLASEVCFKILQLLKMEKLDVSTIASRLGFSEAHISEGISKLEKVGLIKVSYERGRRGVRKVCETAYDRIVIII